MWPVVIAFILVCGYKYINSHYPSKVELRKSNGWEAYFQVALKGCEFLILGVILAFSLEIILYLSMYIVNIPSYFFSCYAPFSYASDLNKYRFEQISFFSLLSALFTILFSVAQASVAKKNSKNQDYKIKEIRELCNKNPINHILLESLDKNLLVQVSLKSRKVYIGIIESARFLDLDNYSESVVSIIPYLSGYRDKYNLSLNIECNYMDIYDSKDINFSSKPLSLSQFRYIIPIHEIESFSLFDVDTYLSFKNTQHK